MSTLSKGLEAICLLKEADRLFASGDFFQATRSYRQALDLSRSEPPEEMDHAGFEASCNSGLSGSLGRLGRVREALAAADAALAFFDKFGLMYPAERVKWLMAIVNRGTSLAHLGRLQEALEAYQRAKQMLMESGADNEENREWITALNQNILAVQSKLRHW